MALVPGQPRGLRRLIVAAIASGAGAACLLALTGCLTVQPAALDADATARPEVAAPAGATRETESSMWPARFGDDRTGTKGRVFELGTMDQSWSGKRIGRFHALRALDETRGTIDAFADGRSGPGGYRYRMEGPGAYIFDAEGEARPTSASTAVTTLMFMSGEVTRTTEVAPGEPEEFVVIQRTWAQLFRHRRAGDDADHGRGLVVVAPGLFGVPEPVIGALVNAMRNRGWNVLRVLAPPSRFTERAEIDMVRFESSIEDGETVYTLAYNAEDFAELSNNRVAEYAYAVEGLTRWVIDNRPELAPDPARLIAMSAAAMSAPTIITRAPDLYGPALLIAGGGDLLSITAKSNYTPLVGSVTLDWSVPDPDDPNGGAALADADALDAVLEGVVPRYLAAAPLDPLNLAPALRDRDFVMLQGTADRAVPSENGDRLWEALGKPERWLTPLDHGPLFVGLFVWTPRILQWLDSTERAAAEPIAAEPDAPQQGPADR